LDSCFLLPCCSFVDVAFYTSVEGFIVVHLDNSYRAPRHHHLARLACAPGVIFCCCAHRAYLAFCWSCVIGWQPHYWILGIKWWPRYGILLCFPRVLCSRNAFPRVLQSRSSCTVFAFSHGRGAPAKP
jgi:hypothetical protein